MADNEMLEVLTKAAVEVAKERSKDLYDDGLKPATREGGEALQSVVGLFNNVVLYPVKKANIIFKYKIEKFENDLRTKTQEIPTNKIIEPPLMISGPTLEALKYTYDTEELRKMYINLLASAMNTDTVLLTHPAYVEIIKSMTPLDANVFKRASELRQIPCARISIGFDNKVYSLAMPKIFAPDLINKNDPFLVSSSIENLCRVGILAHRANTVIGYPYDDYKENTFVKQQFDIFKDIDKSRTLELKVEGEVLLLTDFGRHFAQVCLE